MKKKYNAKIKFTLRHIRTISKLLNPSTNWSNGKSLAVKFKDINEYVNTPPIALGTNAVRYYTLKVNTKTII